MKHFILSLLRINHKHCKNCERPYISTRDKLSSICNDCYKVASILGYELLKKYKIGDYYVGEDKTINITPEIKNPEDPLKHRGWMNE